MSKPFLDHANVGIFNIGKIGYRMLTLLPRYKTRRYKWILAIGLFVRLSGYGVMLRLRGATNSTAELYIVQLIQGAGSGLVQTM